MNNSDNLAALLHLKSKLHKWKNIAILLAVFAVLLVVKSMFGIGFENSVIEEDYIANIKIDQVIFEDDFRSEVLKEVAENKSIKAVIVNINSPGGGIVGSEILFNDLRAIAKEKPTVVLMGSLAASGGYMAAIASDYIVAHNGTLTGSIGVLMEAPEVTNLAEKLGVKLNVYKSSPLKGSPSMFEKSTPTIDAVMQESIADSYQFFADLVKMRRGEKLNKQQLNKIFDGRVFTGRQAFEAGLVDKVGSKQDVLDYLEQQKIDVKKLPIHDIEIEKTDKRFFDKFLNFLPFFDGKNVKNSEQIMAVMP
jgi:protease-4